MGREFHPFDIGKRFRVLPPGNPCSTDGRIDLIMAPGAFGSGEHETTASCLEILEIQREIRGKRVLDLGSGTGILAIAALKLGAKSTLCVDIEPSAVRTCQTNCGLNGVNSQVEHICGTLSDVPENSFGLVLANIYGDILLALANDLVVKTRPSSLLLLSGILWEYNFEVRKKFESLGCEVVENRMLEQFSTVLLKKM
jgi:ribosomal protein L11 methyltransferase